MTHLHAFVRPVARFARDDGGSATVEFALIAPTFLFLFLSSFESGMLMVRQVMLDRAVDMTVRHVRLGHFDTAADADGRHEDLHRDLKATMCQARGNRLACMTELKLEMQQVDPRNWSSTPAEADCVDRANEDTVIASNFTPGVQNQLMILRACELYDPFFPTFGLGATLPEADGAYRITSSTAYVVEPS